MSSQLALFQLQAPPPAQISKPPMGGTLSPRSVSAGNEASDRRFVEDLRAVERQAAQAPSSHGATDTAQTADERSARRFADGEADSSRPAADRTPRRLTGKTAATDATNEENSVASETNTEAAPDAAATRLPDNGGLDAVTPQRVDLAKMDAAGNPRPPNGNAAAPDQTERQMVDGSTPGMAGKGGDSDIEAVVRTAPGRRGVSLKPTAPAAVAPADHVKAALDTGKQPLPDAAPKGQTENAPQQNGGSGSGWTPAGGEETLRPFANGKGGPTALVKEQNAVEKTPPATLPINAETEGRTSGDTVGKTAVDGGRSTPQSSQNAAAAMPPSAKPGDVNGDGAFKTIASLLNPVDRDTGSGQPGANDQNPDFRHPGSTADTMTHLRGGQELPPSEKGAETAKPDRADLMQQVVKKAALSIQNGQSEVRIQLKPEILGEMRMQIATDHQQVSIRISAELASVKDILETHLHQLKAELTNQGVAVEDIEVSVADDSGQHRDAFANKAGSGSRSNSRHGPHPDAAGPNEPGLSGAAGDATAEGRTVDYFA